MNQMKGLRDQFIVENSALQSIFPDTASVGPRPIGLASRPVMRSVCLVRLSGWDQLRMPPFGKNPKGAPGRVASGVFMRLVSLWWEFPPRLNSNISIFRSTMQQFFVGRLKFF
jgi:hypothetical protein